ncbi:Dabb family protein [Runella limosa]|uniref:Dabb family protein n=1 Tax=Runella limosa TaxID=370978 RepID=UPI000490A962|nr:Dabb family protein [Runella limosa]
MLRHSVILKLKSSLTEYEKQAFFEAVDALASIPYVQKFEVLKQISPKNKFEYGISMEFDSQEHYDTYSNHPQHVAFVENFWMQNVEDFLEIDYVTVLTPSL